MKLILDYSKWRCGLYSENALGKVIDTILSREAMFINDDITTTPDEKIELLKELFGEHSYYIEVINHP